RSSSSSTSTASGSTPSPSPVSSTQRCSSLPSGSTVAMTLLLEQRVERADVFPCVGVPAEAPRVWNIDELGLRDEPLDRGTPRAVPLPEPRERRAQGRGAHDHDELGASLAVG